jgi:hypothetical protein
MSNSPKKKERLRFISPPPNQQRFDHNAYFGIPPSLPFQFTFQIGNQSYTGESHIPIINKSQNSNDNLSTNTPQSK